MKKSICTALLALVLTFTLLFGGCSGNDTPPSSSGDASAEENKIDLDLTALSSTMIYAEVYNMTTAPDEYIGKRVKIKGIFASEPGDGRYYFACIIPDATACCSQGIEFVLKDGRKYPDEYPEEGSVITVTGVFGTYFEGQYMYCQLTDAVLG